MTDVMMRFWHIQINLLKQADASANWFVTHDTPLQERLRSYPKFELEIHPNFNFLLQGDDCNAWLRTTKFFVLYQGK